jgi:hypothetical protein
MRAALFPCLLLTASPALAQSPQTEKDARIFSLVAEVAPQWSTPTPWDYGEVTDSTDVSLTLTARPQITKDLELAISRGPKATLDADNDNPAGKDSAFGISAKGKYWMTPAFAFTGSVAYEKKFKDFFDDPNGSKKVYTAGVDFKRIIKGSKKFNMTLTVSALYGITDVTDDSADHDFAQLVGKFDTPLWSWAKLSLEANGARRWFDEVRPTAGFRERRTEWFVSGGLNFAPGIIKLLGDDPDNHWLRTVKVGYKYFRRRSNIDGNDRTNSSPSLSLAIGKDF